MDILAHRGWWLDRQECNSIQAFSRAFAGGFGVETDVRDHDGQLVISHDPPLGRSVISFDDFLALYVDAGQPGTLAINIKADGLQAALDEALRKYDIRSVFVFDMSVPDALGYLTRTIPAFTRHSEYEERPSFYDRAAGVWMDAFVSDWITPADVALHLEKGRRVALVSPELHRRPHLKVWETWRGLPEDVMICTDFPSDAAAFFAAAK
jgi:glycerophosphoryl diester phosphodiesterase